MQNGSGHKLSICFGLAIVNLVYVQPGVLKCMTPSHEPGKVELKLFFDGTKTDLLSLGSRKPP